jgi:hypothetical protein
MPPQARRVPARSIRWRISEVWGASSATPPATAAIAMTTLTYIVQRQLRRSSSAMTARRREQRAERSLHGAGGDEHAEINGRAADGGGPGEPDHAGEEHPLAAEDVREATPSSSRLPKASE